MLLCNHGNRVCCSQSWPEERRCISMSHAWHRLCQELTDCAALLSLGPPRTASAARTGCLGDSTALGTGLAQLCVSPVPGQPAWQPQEHCQAHPARTCAVLWLSAPAAGCSLFPFPAKSLHPSGRQLAARVWDWQGREGRPWLPRSADCAGFCPNHTGRTCCHGQARAGLCCPATLCKGTSFAFLPAGKKSGLHHFFFHPESTADASFSCPSGSLRSGNPKTTVGWSKSCPDLHLRAGSAGG